MQDLFSKVQERVEEHMRLYDGSHDFHHIQRVVGLANHLYNQLATDDPELYVKLDLNLINLCAMLHDIGDRKYLKQDEDGTVAITNLLLDCNAGRSLALKVQTICSAVSYSGEIRDPAHVMKLIEQYPELAVVQDADRLDSLGAIGIGRTFTFGGTQQERGRRKNDTIKQSRDMASSMHIFKSRHFGYEPMMKTRPGRRMAKEKIEIMKAFKKVWDEELDMQRMGEAILMDAAGSSPRGDENVVPADDETSS